MSAKQRNPHFLARIASALGITRLTQQHPAKVSGLRLWQKVLVRHHGEEKAQQLAAAVRRQYAALLAEKPLPANLALRWHMKDKILPGLALYRVLLQEYAGDRQAALAEVDEAFRFYTLTVSRVQFAPLQLLRNAFPVFRLAFSQTMKQFPPEGWDFTYLENSAERVAFNSTRCFYLNTLTACGVPELTPSFCKTDDVMAEAFPPSICFVRLHTQGRGDALCDFQYCRAKG